MSIVSGTVSGIMGANAQSEASKRNRKNVRDTNAANYRIFQEGRGSGGSALFPLYAKGFERDFYNDIARGFREPRRSLEEYRRVAAKFDPTRFNPMRRAAEARAGEIFDGGVEGRLLENFQPVANNRVAYSRQSSVNALNKTLSDIKARMARAGFIGDSSAAQDLRFKAAKGAAEDVAMANLANLEEERSIRDRAGVELPLQSLDLPSQFAQADQSMMQSELIGLTAGDDAFLDSLARRAQLANALRIAPGQFSYAPLPREEPNLGAAGAALAGAGRGAAQIADYYLKNKQADRYFDALADRGYTPTAGGGFAGYTKGYNDEVFRVATTPDGAYYSAPVDGSIGDDAGFWSGLGNWFGF